MHDECERDIEDAVSLSRHAKIRYDGGAFPRQEEILRKTTGTGRVIV